MPVAIVNVQRISSMNHLHTAARHNLREIAAEISDHGPIDADRTCLNRILAGSNTAKEVMNQHRQLLDAAQPTPLRKDGRRAKRRHDMVVAVELMISVPPSALADEAAFFDDVLGWIVERFGVPVLSAVWHRDQGCEHVHCLLLPLKDGRMVGSALAGRYDRMHDDFYRKVGQKHGLARKLHLDARSRKAGASMAMGALDANPALLQDPAVRAALLACIERDPGQLLEAVGLIQERPPEKEWVKTMTRSVPSAKPIGFAGDGPAADPHADDRTLSCVRFRSEPPPVADYASPAAAEQGDAAGVLAGEVWMVPLTWQLAATGHSSPSSQPIPIVLDAAAAQPANDDGDSVASDFLRVPDDQHPAAFWDADLGEFRAPPTRLVSNQARADAAVQSALTNLTNRTTVFSKTN